MADAATLPLDDWSDAARAILVELADQAMQLAGLSFDPLGAPLPGAVAVRRARFGVNLELTQSHEGGWFWRFRGRHVGTEQLLARARIFFGLAPRLSSPDVPATMVEYRLIPPCVLTGLDDAARQKMFGARATAATCLVFRDGAVPIMAWVRGQDFVLPGGRVVGRRLPRGPGLALIQAMADARPSLTDGAAGDAGATGPGPRLPVRAARALAAAHAGADAAMAGLSAPDGARRIGLAAYGMERTQGVIEVALTADGEPADAAERGALRLAVAVTVEPDPQASLLQNGLLHLVLSLSPPDILAEGAVFDAFAAAIAEAAKEPEFFQPLAPLVARASLTNPAKARLVMRYGAAGRDDADLVAWDAGGPAPALFTLGARVDGGNLAPRAVVADPVPVAGDLLPEAVGARLAAIAGLLKSWVGEAA